ncbi:GDSL-type esterase/lipase family protein [Mycobacterium sp. E740]|uniref:GDSL-type esterase/lipase family protein n=1 Tax=Mycobacterium sp. E740 TaxID=1834149 RepID=UPI0007FEC11B|nr:GDSL-type esterase/lipase family protein [Mycobacterium sp. E740]OBI80256.1 hypothetical protein A5663_17770 [Mycobacterium sp. E740]
MLREKFDEAATVDGDYEWWAAEAGAPGPTRRSARAAAVKASALRTFGGLVVAAVLWLVGLRLGAVLLTAVLIALAVVSIAWPSVGATIDGAIARLAGWVGRLVAAVVLALVYFVVFMPISLYRRMFGRDLLASPGATPESTWIAKPRVSDPVIARRQFSVEPEVLVLKPRGRAATAKHLALLMLRVAAVLIVLDLLIGIAFPQWAPHGGVRVGGKLGTWDEIFSAQKSSAAMAGDQQWAGEWFNEFKDIYTHNAYVPLLGMVNPDHKGEYINIADRARKTYVADGVGDDATEIYFLGGSTTWGYGQRDLYTMPSQLARIAEKDGVPVRVSNYGQVAWSIWQELGLLQQLLSEGHIPDVVVFYDGANDVAEQVEQLTTEPTYPGGPYVGQAVERARMRGGLAGVKDSLVGFYENHSILTRIALTSNSKQAGPKPTPEIAQERAHNAVQLYDRAVDVVEHLAKSYGFKAVFVWQPLAYTTEGADAERYAHPDDWGLGAAYVDSTKLMRPPVINLADALDGEKQAVFIDNAHTNELGAELVARAIYPHLGLKQ